jgi:hypothetical protein
MTAAPAVEFQARAQDFRIQSGCGTIGRKSVEGKMSRLGKTIMVTSRGGTRMSLDLSSCKVVEGNPEGDTRHLLIKGQNNQRSAKELKSRRFPIPPLQFSQE